MTAPESSNGKIHFTNFREFDSSTLHANESEDAVKGPGVEDHARRDGRPVKRANVAIAAPHQRRPIMAGTFATWQPEYATRGFATFPCAASSANKRPLVRGYGKIGIALS